MNPPLHIEIVQKKRSGASASKIKEIVHTYMSNFASIRPGATITNQELTEHEFLMDHVDFISVCDVDYDSEIQLIDVEVVYHVYILDSFGAETDKMTDSTTDEEISAAEVWSLPSQEFHGLWENLIYDSKLKQDTLRFVETAFEFSDCLVDTNVIAWNRVVLLHGPPGTGKTSLCRALAHKLSIRLRDRYPRARLLEINAHSLFSKWFSESSKLIAKLFDRIRDIVQDRKQLVCVLVDEVESLAHTRKAALAGLEPSDSIRAVNAILTQLDRLKYHPNVLVLTTSNVTEAIDIAFVDRADIKRYVGPPTARATYEILRSCCSELMSKGIVHPMERLFPFKFLEQSRFIDTEGSRASLRLWEVAQATAETQLSGRALRKLPFLAKALHCPGLSKPHLFQFTEALQSALDQYLSDLADLDPDKNKVPKKTMPIANGH